MNPRTVLVASKGSYRPPFDISDDKTKPRAYYIRQSQMSYRNGWYDQRPSNAVPGHTENKPYRNESALSYKLEYTPDVTDVTVIRSVNKLFADAIDLRSYRLTEKSAWYDDDVDNEVNKMMKKTNVQLKDGTFNGRDRLSIIAFYRSSSWHATYATFKRGQLYRSSSTT